MVQEFGDLRPDEIVVVPTRRLAHHLQTRWNERCAERGLQVWRTPEILTWGELLARMFHVDRRDGRLAGRWLPQSMAELWWERSIRRDPASQGLLAPAGLGSTAYKSWRRLHEYLIPLQALSADSGAEQRAFRRWTEAYLAWLADGHWVDPAQAAALVTASGAGSRLRLLGFDAFTPEQGALLERLRAAGIGITLELPEPIPADPGAVGWVPCNDRKAEIEAATRWAARELDGSRGRRLAIVVPGLRGRREEIRRSLEKVFLPSPGTEPLAAAGAGCFDLAAARPLARQPLVAGAVALLRAFADPQDPASGEALLQSAYCAGARAERVPRARLDAGLRQRGRFGLALDALAVAADREACPELSGLIRRGGEQSAKWPPRDHASAWSQRFHDLLGAVGWPGENLGSPEHQAWQRWLTLLGEFGSSDDVLGALSAGAALRMLRELAERALFEPQEQGAPLLVIDPETCAGMTFDAVWVCGLDAENWPRPSIPDPFLPREWQLRSGVPGASPSLAQESARRSLLRLQASAPEVILSVPAFERDAPLLPSALLAGIPQRRDVPRWPVADPITAAFDGRPVFLRLTDGRMPEWSEGEGLRGGARVLELQAACPLHAQAEMRLFARPVDDPEPGVDSAARGRLVHDALAGVWRALGSRARLVELPEAGRRSLVRSAIRSAFASRVRDGDDVRRRLLEIEAEWLEDRILDLLHAEEARPAFHVQSIEEDVDLEIGGLKLRLRPDRVDRLQDGSLAVIDYKTGSDADPRAWTGERPRLPQLPVYAEALGAARVTAVAFGRVRSGVTGYTGAARSGEVFPGLDVPGERGALREFASWDELAASWSERLTSLAREFRSGEARLAFDRGEACRYCPLPALCRVAETGPMATDDDDG